MLYAFIRLNAIGEFYYIVEAGNHENVHTSEGYKRKQSAQESIQKLFPEAQVTDETIGVPDGNPRWTQ